MTRKIHHWNILCIYGRNNIATSKINLSKLFYKANITIIPNLCKNTVEKQKQKQKPIDPFY